MEVNKRKCGTCAFQHENREAVLNPNHGKYGEPFHSVIFIECRYNPPCHVDVKGKYNIGIWPQVGVNDWCSKWKIK